MKSSVALNLTLLTSARYQILTAASGTFSDGSLAYLTNREGTGLLDAEIGYAAPSSLYDDLTDIPRFPSPIAPLPALKAARSDFHIVLCAGHSRPGDSGALSTSGVTEHRFYSRYIIHAVADALRALGFTVTVIEQYQGRSYGAAMRWLAKKLKELGADLAYEFHFNAASKSAEGFEALFWHRSKVSDDVAEAMQRVQVLAYPEMKDRGIEPLGDQAHERGTLFCSLPHCPSIILEPFFGTNVAEVAEYMSEKGRPRFIKMLTQGIEAGADRLLQSAA